jgi:hypothetical protein
MQKSNLDYVNRSDKDLDWKGKCCPLRGEAYNARAPYCNAGTYKVLMSNDVNCFTYCRDCFKECSNYKKAGKNPFTGENEEARRIIMAKKAEKKTPRKCGCGCGGSTKGGEFLPGHDARHKGNLKRAYLDPKTADAKRADVKTELERRKWGLPVAKKKAAPKKEVAKKAPAKKAPAKKTAAKK